jgi:hypothetical protein
MRQRAREVIPRRGALGATIGYVKVIIRGAHVGASVPAPMLSAHDVAVVNRELPQVDVKRLEEGRLGHSPTRKHAHAAQHPAHLRAGQRKAQALNAV